MAENCDPKVVQKSRKLWIESTPFTPEGYSNQNSAHDGSSPPIVKLTHFTTKPVIDFGNVKVGQTVTRQLVIENPNFYDVDVSVEKFPWKKNFGIDQEIFNVDEESVRYLKMTWTPTQSGNCREVVMMKYDSGFRVHAVIIGHAVPPKMKQKTRTRRGQAPSRTLKKSAKNKSDQPVFAESPSHLIDNLENIEPSSLFNRISDGNETSRGQKSLFTNYGSPMSIAASMLNDQHEFSPLRSALLPLHVLNSDNERDSCGSITAPATPSGLDAPTVESSLASPAVRGLSTFSKPINSTNLSPPKGYVHLEAQRETFCIDPTRSLFPNRCSVMAEPEITGRPTYVLPAMREFDLPFTPSSSGQTSLRNKQGNYGSANAIRRAKRDTPRSHRRSRTFTKKISLNSEGKDGKKFDMVDYALGVIGSDKKTEGLDSDRSSPDDSLEVSTPKMEELTLLAPVIGMSQHIETTTTSAIDVCDEFVERLSSTHSHERTVIGCLPVPDISLITNNSPAKARKRKSSEYSPIKGGEPKGKRAILVRTGGRKATPRKGKPAKKLYTTPKGRALLRRRAAKGSVSETLPILKVCGGSAKKKASRRLSVTNRFKKSVCNSPGSSATKRSKSVLERQNNLKKRKVKMPVAQLLLNPSRKTVAKSSVIVPTAYSSGNRYYDERWRQKQEYAYATWLNYILTPDEFKATMESKEGTSKGKNKTMHHSDVFSQKFNKGNITLPALSREKASFRAYRITTRLNRLRRAAMNLFESKDIAIVIRKIEEAVENGHIQLRSDKELWADIGNRAKVIDLLLNFHPLWLRLGLEVTFGVELFKQANTDMNALSNFIARKLLSSVEIEQKFAHPTVPHSFKPGYTREISKHILKRFLILMYFLEQAKQHRLIDHDPCLFQKESDYKNCKDILISFSRDLLRGEGDVIKHLSFLGYKVKYQQTYIDEFEFGIRNITIDLRDGIRLVRIVELLFRRHDLTSKMRVPAGSLLQKKHNVNIALKELESHGVEMCDASGKKIEADHIVKGHCEMTLGLLWNIASHFQLENGIDKKNLKGEIEYLKKNLRLKHMMQNTKDFYEEEDSAKSKTTGVSTLLLEWCRLVCAFKSVPVYNFGAAFSDGRILACLVSHYQSNLIHSLQICMKTTLSRKDPDPILALKGLVQCHLQQLDDSSSSDNADSEAEINLVQLLRNEKQNLKLVQNAAYEMGGIPNLLRIDDICNTIPDDRVVRLLVAFLCIRLLDIGSEDRAARTIQVAWRAYNYKKRILAERKASEEEERRRAKAATVIQVAYKAYRQHISFQELKAAALVLQRAWRSRKEAHSIRVEFLKLKCTTILAQSLFRTKMARRLVAIRACYKRQEREKQSAAASKLQYFWRGRVLRKELQRKRRAAINIQRFFRAWLASKIQRSEYLSYKGAVRKVQIRWRETLEMRKQVAIYSTKREAVVVIQRAFRAHLVKKRANAAICIQRNWRATVLMRKHKTEYRLKHMAIITIQNAYRSLQAKRVLSRLKSEQRCAIVIQRKWKATLAMRSQREQFLRMKASATTIQTAFRSLLARRILIKLRMRSDSAKIIQRKWRVTILMRNARREFLKRKDSAILIQCAWRCFLAKKEKAKMQKRMDSILVIQRRWRVTILMRNARREFLKRKDSAIHIQCAWRCFLAKKEKTQMQKRMDSILVIQRKWKVTVLMRNARREFLKRKDSAIHIQCAWRCFLAKKEKAKMQKRMDSILVIQRRWRATLLARKERRNFLRKRNAVVQIQSALRCVWAKRELTKLKQQTDSALVIQKHWRATLLMKSGRNSFLRIKAAVIKIQSHVRRILARNKVENLKSIINAAIIIQAYWRGFLATKSSRAQFLQQRQSSTTIQSYFRRHIARKILAQKKKENHAAKIIQRNWRATVLMRKHKAEYRLKHMAIITMQNAYRSLQARRVLSRLKREQRCAIVIQRKWKATLAMRSLREEFLRMKASAITIQTVYRSLLARRILIKLRMCSDSAKMIQRKWRVTVLMRNARREFLKRKDSAILIQCAWRCILAKKEKAKMQKRMDSILVIQRKWKVTVLMRNARREFLKRKDSAIHIQCAWRCFLAKKEKAQMQKRMDSILVIQRKWKVTVLMRNARREFLKRKDSAIHIQCAWRCFLAKKEKAQMQKRMDSILVIQRKWKVTVLMRNARREFLKRKDSAIHIQCAWRCFLAKKGKAQMQKRMDSILVIQRKWKVTVLMRNARREFLKRKDSAIHIQCAWRCFLAKKEKAKMQKRMDSILVIQGRWRATLLAQKERRNFLRKRNAVIQIQSALRCVWAKRELTKLKHQTDSALVIQKHWRATLLMKSGRNSFLRIKAAVIKIQSHVRRILARNKVEILKGIINAARILQAYWRGFLATKSSRAQFLQQKQSSTTIQSYFRRHVAQKVLTQKKKENHAAKVIQRKWRATRLMKTQRENFLAMKNAAILIQCSWRRYLAKRILAELTKRNDAVMIIQKSWRATLLMRRERHEFVRMKSACVVIQCAFRYFLTRRILDLKRQRLDAAIALQRKLGATLKMKDDEQKFVRKRDAAILFQSSLRGFLARKVLLQLKKELHAAQIIQQRWRAYCVMKEVRRNFLLKKKSALVIQIAFKGMLARRLLLQLRQRRDAAVIIQHHWQATLKMKAGRKKFLLKKRVSVVIQCAWRCFAAKKHLKHLRERHNAALLIQVKWRACVLMKTQVAEFLKIKNAAVKLQSSFRCILAKRELATLRKCHTAAVIIQQKWKATLLMRNARTEFTGKKSAAVTIQCSYRCFVARKILYNLQKRNAAACVIQRRWRGVRQRSEFLQVKKYVITIQCAVRGFLAKMYLSRMKEEDKAARIIQAVRKGSILMKREREYFLNLKKSAIIIQRMFRCYVARKTVTETRKHNSAANKIQIWWRAMLCMKEQRRQFLRTRNAVIIIQSHFRRYLAQKIIKQLREEDGAAKIIQRRWRATLLMRRERDGYLKKNNAVAIIQRGFKCFWAKGMLSKMKEKRNAAIVIQRRWRAFVAMRKQKKDFLLLKKSVVIIQCATRKFLAKKILEKLKQEWDAANLLQMHWRSYSLAKRERQRFKNIVNSARMIQRVFRGYLTRRVITDAKVLRAKKKCTIANRYARQHSNRKICNRMNSALKLLLEAKGYDFVYSTLEDLHSLSLLLPYCCERISEASGTEVLCQLITSSNRSFHAAFVQKFSINILLNLIKNPSTRYDTGQILGTIDPKSGSTPVEMLVNVLSRFRDKGGRDPSHILVFCATCTLLVEFCRVEENVEILKSKTESVEMIHDINLETTSRMKTKAGKTKEAKLKKDRESIGYLTVSSSLGNTSVLNMSSHLDVTARETSFIRDMDVRRVSTPKTRKSRGKTESKDPTVAKRPCSRNPPTTTAVSKLQPLPQKLKQSMLPQKASWNTNIPIHRSKKVTKPQSPKFRSSSRSKKSTAGNDPRPLRSIQNHPQINVNVKLAYNENDPLSCINALSGIFL